MKPQRIRMTHNLLLNYGLYRKMEIYVSIANSFRIFYFSKLFVVPNCLQFFFKEIL